MRDPAGRLRFAGDSAIRDLIDPGNTTAFLRHAASQRLVDTGLLVPFTWRTPDTLVSPRYGFVSQPTDWCDRQLHAAALLTLDVAAVALEAGFELKDASAWNVIFDGAKPVFCDHLSFQPLCNRQWWAFGQFCRHFTFPLAASRLRRVTGRETFMVHRDGLTADQARALLGSRGLMSRLLPVLLQRADAATEPAIQPANPLAPRRSDVLHARLFDYARRSLLPPRMAPGGTAWSGYKHERTHYDQAASDDKFATVQHWLSRLAPTSVLDLGCNTGEFSRAALALGARVIAVDGDHDCVQQLFDQAKGSTRLHPVVANLGDLHGGRGWNAAEHAGLAARLAGQADLLLMLALTHHLHFSESIPLPDIAAFAAGMTTAHLLLELMPADDPMVQRLAAQRRRPTDSFSLQAQLDAFIAHFDLVERHPLPQSGRVLVLLRKRS